MSTPSAPGAAPEPKDGARSAVPAEQLLRQESERITELLRARRKATMAVAIVFALATIAAVMLLARYVRDEQTRIDVLRRELATANGRLRDQGRWLTKLDSQKAFVDSILYDYNALIAGVRASTARHADSLVTRSDSALRYEMLKAGQGAVQTAALNAASGDTAVFARARKISDSLGVRLSQAETDVKNVSNATDTLPRAVARHGSQLRDIDKFVESTGTRLGNLEGDVNSLQGAVTRDTLRHRSFQIRVDTSLASIRRRLEQPEPPRQTQRDTTP